MESQRLIEDMRLAVVRLERKLRKSAGGGGLTPSQYSALFTLDRHGPFRLGEMARREQITKSTVTRLVGGLEARSLVVRTPDEEDGRSTLVGISEAGRSLLAEVARASNDYLRARLEALPAADLDRLVAAVPVLVRLSERE